MNVHTRASGGESGAARLLGWLEGVVKEPMVRPELINPRKAFPNEAIWELRDLMPAVDGSAPLTIGP
jgi:hypothetical protein